MPLYKNQQKVAPLIDGFARRISYLRVSVTDRCNLRCTYCMKAQQTFLPRAEVLDLEELDRLCTRFIAHGTRRLRLTGGEPLVRRGFMDLVHGLSRHLDSGALDEITLTTNGTELAHFAGDLAAVGVRRVNVSLDTTDAAQFAELTRGGDLASVLRGIDAAQSAGLSVKLNRVMMRGVNEVSLVDDIRWAHGRGLSLTLIETMPMGEVDVDRTDHYVPLDSVKTDLMARLTLTPLTKRTGGPARYYRVEETGGELGLITPLSAHFCESCNRVRLTCTGQLYLCLGQDDRVDLRALLRSGADDAALDAAIHDAMRFKPRGHDFAIGANGIGGQSMRTMSVTGG
jgi:GTP 3',8-cyclase